MVVVHFENIIINNLTGTGENPQLLNKTTFKHRE